VLNQSNASTLTETRQAGQLRRASALQAKSGSREQNWAPAPWGLWRLGPFTHTM